MRKALARRKDRRTVSSDGEAGCRGVIRGVDAPLPPGLRAEIVALLAQALVADFLSDAANETPWPNEEMEQRCETGGAR